MNVTQREFLFPLRALNQSGGVRMVCALANGLCEAGARVRIAAPEPTPPVPLDPRVEMVAPGNRGALRNHLALIGEIRRWNGTVVTTGYLTPVLAFLGGCDGNVIALIQNDEPESHIRYGSQPEGLKPLLRWVAEAGYRVPARRIAVSRYVAGRVGRQRIDAVIPAGIAPRYTEAIGTRVPAATDDPPTIGVLASPGRVKGFDTALAAFERMRERGARFRVLACTPPGVSGDVPGADTFPAPWDGDLRPFYNACDIFVFPSRIEGFGLPPLEAMACGCAVVITDSGGVRQYAENGVNCLLVPADAPGALAQALERVVANAPLRAQLCRAGSETAARYPDERFVRDCITFFLTGDTRLLGLNAAAVPTENGRHVAS